MWQIGMVGVRVVSSGQCGGSGMAAVVARVVVKTAVAIRAMTAVEQTMNMFLNLICFSMPQS
jgi:hypothetical protein